MIYSKRLIRNELEVEKMESDHQRQLLKSEIKATEKERKRIAKNLHDEVGTVLSFTSMNLSQALNKRLDEESYQDIIEKSMQSLNKAILDVRRLSHFLLPPTLEMLGLVAALKDVLQNINHEFNIELDASSDLKNLDLDTSMQLYRILLELINNSIKHSGGDTIKIKCFEHGDKANIIYIDNGKGFEYDQGMAKPGLGLKNIESRLNSIDAKYSILTEENSGIKVTIQLSY